MIIPLILLELVIDHVLSIKIFKVLTKIPLFVKLLQFQVIHGILQLLFNQHLLVKVKSDHHNV